MNWPVRVINNYSFRIIKGLQETLGLDLLQGKGKMITYWLLGEHVDRRQQTPAPLRDKNISLYAITNQSGTSMNAIGKDSEDNKPIGGDEADVPLLSITSPSDQHSHA